MARYGVIADVHGNLQALQAVLDALAGQGVTDILCLGDLVGYNASSNECVALLRERRAVCIAGNHDLIALDQLGFERCAPRPEFSLRRTRGRLWNETRSFLRGLPDSLLLDREVALIHGGVDDVCLYMRSPRDIAANAGVLQTQFPPARICLFGHTHVPAIHEHHGTHVRSRTLLARNVIDRDVLTFVNPGSVDAARRPDKRAEFAVFDTDSWILRLHRVPYDHDSAERAAEREGYRMTAMDEKVMAGRRLLRKVRHKVSRQL